MTTPPPSTPDAPTLAEKMPMDVDLLHILRNPYGYSDDVIRWARNLAADKLEKLDKQQARREVPREATEAMTDAMWEAKRKAKRGEDYYSLMWRAAYDAAQGESP